MTKAICELKTARVGTWFATDVDGSDDGACYTFTSAPLCSLWESLTTHGHKSTDAAAVAAVDASKVLTNVTTADCVNWRIVAGAWTDKTMIPTKGGVVAHLGDVIQDKTWGDAMAAYQQADTVTHAEF
jgi:hypothetical protein